MVKNPQKCPTTLQILNEDQLKELCLYKHSSPKTTIELWMINNVSNRLEILFPESWTPNVITLLGNCALPLSVGLTMYSTGVKLTLEEKIDDSLLILGGLAL
jgi:hypothetical protein